MVLLSRISASFPSGLNSSMMHANFFTASFLVTSRQHICNKSRVRIADSRYWLGAGGAWDDWLPQTFMGEIFMSVHRLLFEC